MSESYAAAASSLSAQVSELTELLEKFETEAVRSRRAAPSRNVA